MVVQARALGFEEAQIRIREIQDRIRRPVPVMRYAAERIEKLIGDAFKKQESPWGDPWEPLSDAALFGRIADRRGGGLGTVPWGKPSREGKRQRATRITRVRRARRAADQLRERVRAGDRLEDQFKPLQKTGAYRRSHHAVARADRVLFGVNLEYQHQWRKAIVSRETLPVLRHEGRWVWPSEGPAGRERRNIVRRWERYIARGRM